MNITRSVTTCFRKYADFSSRATRSEFWWFILFIFVIEVFFEKFDLQVFSFFENEDQIETFRDATLSFIGLSNGLFSSLFGILIFIPMLAVTSRRLHDVGFMGWWQMVPYVAIYSVALLPDQAETGLLYTLFCAFVLLVFAGFIVIWSKKGASQPNRFGPPNDYHDVLRAFD